jgi:hypothetical protein
MKKFIIIILHIIISLPITSLATSTIINEVTDLFDKHIEGKEELLQNLEEQNNTAIDQIKSGAHHDSIEGIGEAGVKAGELGAIKETELDNAGRSMRASKEYQFYDENELEPDYTKPGNRLHREDSDDIVASTDDTMSKIGSNFMAKLNSEGFDCKTVKGSVIKEPTYYIEIKREQQKNTEYDQLFCEEPRNNYSCNDTATLTCAKIVKKFKNPEARKIKLDGHLLHHNKNHWGWARKWEKKRWGWYIHSHHPKGGLFGPQSESPWRKNPAAIIADARAHIANHLGVSIEQIGEHVEFPPDGRGIGNINPVGCRWRVAWDLYEFGYTYREVYHVCEQWAEDWNERCTLK